MAGIRIMALAAAILWLSACGGGVGPVAGTDSELARAQEEYLTFHTEADHSDRAPAEQPAAPVAAQPRPETTGREQPAPAVPAAPAPVAEVVAEPEPAPVETVATEPEPAPKPTPVRAPAPPVQVARAPAEPVQPEAEPEDTDAALLALIAQPDVDAALEALHDLASEDVLAQVEAVRVINAQRPPAAAHELYVAAFTKQSPFVRECAISALLAAFPDMGTDWGRRLLATRSGRPEDRYNVARQVIANKTVVTYPAALAVLAQDYHGQALYDAREAILAAGDPIVMPLMHLALRHKGLPNAFVARRLYRWIQNAGRITEAYYDTFNGNPSDVGVKLFRDRYGQDAKPLLTKALDQTDDAEMQAHIQQALDELANPAAKPTPRRHRSAPNVLYLIIYKTSAGEKRILTDTPIWANDEPGKTERHDHGRNWVSQKTIAMKPQQLAALGQLTPELLPTLKVDSQSVDRLDLRPR